MNVKKFNYTFEAIMIILGIIIIVNPAVIDTIFNIFGIIIVGYNVFKFVMGRLGKAPEYPMLRFICGLLLGIKFGIPLVLGCFVLYNGIERLIFSYQIKQHGGNSGNPLIMGIIFSLLGIIVIINPFKTSALLFRILGIVLAGIGVMRIVSNIRVKKQNEDIIPDIIEGTFRSKD